MKKYLIFYLALALLRRTSSSTLTYPMLAHPVSLRLADWP